MQDGPSLCYKMRIGCGGKQRLFHLLHLLSFGNCKTEQELHSCIVWWYFHIICGFPTLLWNESQEIWLECIVTFQEPTFYFSKSPVTLLSLGILVIKLGQEEKEQERNTKGDCDLKISLEKTSKVPFGLPEGEIRRMAVFSMLGMI